MRSSSKLRSSHLLALVVAIARAILAVLVDGDEACLEHLVDGVLSLRALHVLGLHLGNVPLELVKLLQLGRDLPLQIELLSFLLLNLVFGLSALR